MTFINKWDRPGKAALEILDELEETLVVEPTPVTWPVGIAGEFQGVIHQDTGAYTKFERTARGATIAPETDMDAAAAAQLEGEVFETANEEVGLLKELGRVANGETFAKGESTPVFFGSALTNFGVRHLLDGVINLVPPPSEKTLADGSTRALDDPFCGLVFKVQAGMDKAHRDRIAFVRVCSCLLYTSPSPRDRQKSRMPSSA